MDHLISSLGMPASSASSPEGSDAPGDGAFSTGEVDHDSGLGVIVERLSELVVGPVVLQDQDMRVLASAGDLDKVLLDPTRCHSTRNALRQVASLRTQVRLEVGNQPVRLVTPVIVAEELLAYLTIVSEDPDDDAVAAKIQGGVNAAAIEIAVERRVQEILGHDRQGFFVDLLEGRRSYRILQRGFRLGYDLEREHLPLAFALQPQGDRSPLGSRVDQLLKVVRSAVPPRAVVPSPIIGRDEDAVLVFLPTLDRDAAVDLAREVLARTRQLGLRAAAGTGPACHRVEDFGPATAKAEWAARVRLIAGHTELVSSFDELGVSALLFKIEDRAQLEEFVERWLGRLKDYDRQHQTQLTLTLRTLLETRSLRAGAEMLHIHMSTLKYRVKRINEILDAEYQDPETSFNLQVALRIDEMLEGLR